MSAILPSFVMANSIASFPFIISAHFGITRYQFSRTSSITRFKYGPKSTPLVSLKMTTEALAFPRALMPEPKS